MNAMRSIGTTIPSSLLRGVVKVRDLEYYEGCLLAEFKNHQGDTLLFSWADSDAEANRWLAFRIVPRDLARYMRRIETLRGLLYGCRDGFVYLVDANNNGAFTRVRLVALGELPADYIPSEQSLFDPSLMPVADPGAHDILINGKWELNDLGQFPRTYTDAYTMVYAFRTRAGVQLPEVAHLHHHDIKTGRGLASNNMYSQLRGYIPPSARPRLDAVQYASPGVISMHLDEATAQGVAQSVDDYDQKRNELDFLYGFLFKVRHDQEERNAVTDLEIMERAARCSNVLGLDHARLSKSAGTLECLADILLAHVRRLRRLAEYVGSGKVESL